MIVNADKFQAIIVKRNLDVCNQYTLNIDGNQVASEKSKTIFRWTLFFWLLALTQKASNQLNAISRLQSYLGFKEKEFIINGFVYANFNYGLLIWHFCSTKFVCNKTCWK